MSPRRRNFRSFCDRCAGTAVANRVRRFQRCHRPQSLGPDRSLINLKKKKKPIRSINRHFARVTINHIQIYSNLLSFKLQPIKLKRNYIVVEDDVGDGRVGMTGGGDQCDVITFGDVRLVSSQLDSCKRNRFRFYFD